MKDSRYPSLVPKKSLMSITHLKEIITMIVFFFGLKIWITFHLTGYCENSYALKCLKLYAPIMFAANTLSTKYILLSSLLKLPITASVFSRLGCLRLNEYDLGVN